MIRTLISTLFCLILWPAHSQSFSNPYPQGYFRWPVNLKPDIVANMGELRPNHWHMGLDVRTNGHENEPVYAAAEGYIAHIGIRPSSFGRFIIINHPNGLSTLYGHLNTFAPAVEAWVTQQQYQQESWAVELKPAPDVLPVRKGDFISYSGNTGGSQGPHVHFEIRSTTTDECLNPQLFGFGLPDKVAPTLTQIAIYDRSKSIYAGKPVVLTPKRTDSGYIIPRVPFIEVQSGVVGLGIRAFDRRTGTNNQDGIFSAYMWMDGKPVSGFSLDSISYDETGYYNVHVDYRLDYNGGPEFQLLNKLPNDRSGVYHAQGDGLLHLEDTLIHEIHVEIKDSYQNSITLNFRVRLDPGAAPPVRETGGTRLIPGETMQIDKPGFRLELQPENLYDTVDLVYRTLAGSGSPMPPVHQVSDESIPVHQLLKVSMQPASTLTPEQREHVMIMRKGRSTNLKKAIWENEWMTAAFGDFGNFSAFIDQTPPVVNAPGRGDTINLSGVSRIVFTPTDVSGIEKFRAELDGQWLRFTNDKSRSWIYVFDERVPYGTYNLKVTVEDKAGNITVKEWWFKRAAYTPPVKKKYTKKPAAKKKKKTGKK